MSKKHISAKALADRATQISRLVDDLAFEEACNVLIVVLTAKTNVCSVPQPDPGKLRNDQLKLSVEDRGLGPGHPDLARGPNLKQVPISVPNKIPIFIDHPDASCGENVDQQVDQRESGDLHVTVWNVRFNPGIF